MILEQFQLKGKTALVSGSRRGLGAGMALGLAEAGADVIVHGSHAEGLAEVEETIRACGARAASVVFDLSAPENGARMVEAAIAKFGRLDILVNNAGTLKRAKTEESSAEDWNTVINVNLNAVFHAAQAAGRHMLQNRGGKIVNIASLLSFQGGLFVPSYAASKGAVGQLTKALANEWASKNINVNAIAPGYMETDITSALRNDPVRSRQIVERIPAGRWGTPRDLAGAVVFLASEASSYLHGHVLTVDGGWLGR